MENPFDLLLSRSSTFLLIAGRVAGLIFTTPLLSTRAVSRIVKVALALLVAFICMPYYPASEYKEVFN